MLRRYFTALDKADQALSHDLPKYLPLWKKNIPPQFSDRQWHVERWGPYDRVMAAIERWGMGAHMEDKTYEHISLPLLT